MKKIKILFLTTFFCICFFSSLYPSSESAFTQIYETGMWGGPWFSGSGAQIENARTYVNYLQDFLKEHKIRSVVDLGCGDWQFSQYIQWDGIDYLGIDVVKPIVERNQHRYGQPSITFMHLDGIDRNLPEADLLICKDVLQHLPNDHIVQLIKQFSKFKYCLITNDIDPVTLTSTNPDTYLGGYHGVDLRTPPYSLRAEAVLVYPSEHVTKQVLSIYRD